MDFARILKIHFSFCCPLCYWRYIHFGTCGASTGRGHQQTHTHQHDRSPVRTKHTHTHARGHEPSHTHEEEARRGWNPSLSPGPFRLLSRLQRCCWTGARRSSGTLGENVSVSTRGNTFHFELAPGRADTIRYGPCCLQCIKTDLSGL